MLSKEKTLAIDVVDEWSRGLVFMNGRASISRYELMVLETIIEEKVKNRESLRKDENLPVNSARELG